MYETSIRKHTYARMYYLSIHMYIYIKYLNNLHWKEQYFSVTVAIVFRKLYQILLFYFESHFNNILQVLKKHRIFKDENNQKTETPHHHFYDHLQFT